MKNIKFLSISFFIICIFLCFPGLTFAEEERYSEKGSVKKGFGIEASLLGPRSLFTIEANYQVSDLLQLGLATGFNHASADSTSGDATAEAEATLMTPYLVGRLFIFERHNPIFEAGFGCTYMKLIASGYDSYGNSINYERVGTPPIILGGIGYGYRAPFGLHVNIIAGYLVYLSDAGDSKTEVTGSFSESDRREISDDLDDISNDLTDSGLYLRIGLGFVF